MKALVTRSRPAATLAFVLLVFAASPARAGDFAERHILGFSPDGGTFAFEQFGVQDGSGFPYTDIFVIDTTTDQWVEGSPFRVLLKDDRAQLKWARREAVTKAGNTLRERLISAPGRLLASNPPQELSADPHRVTVNAGRVATAPPERWTFTMEETAFADSECAGIGVSPVKGFTLTLQQDGTPPRVLHADSSVPRSRGCPLRYAITDVVIHEPQGAPRVVAVLVSIFAHGFEGPDRRFLAITARTP
jgi:predicted secreted protein